MNLQELKELQRLSEGIILPSKSTDEVIYDLQSRYSARKTRRKMHQVAALCIAVILFSLCVKSMIVQPEIIVYASMAKTDIRLQENEQVSLPEQNTPLGRGYILRIDLPNDQYMYTLTDEASQYPQNVFHDGSNIYWLPNGSVDNFRDENGNMIELPRTDQSTINIHVFSKNKEVIVFQLNLSKTSAGCNVTLMKLNK